MHLKSLLYILAENIQDEIIISLQFMMCYNF